MGYRANYRHALPGEPVPNMNFASFIRSFKQLITCYGCLDNVILDNGPNFASEESRNLFASRFIE